MFSIPLPGQTIRYQGSGDIDVPLLRNLNELFRRFHVQLDRALQLPGIDQWAVRATEPTNAACALDRENIWVVGELARGMGYMRKLSFLSDEVQTRDVMLLVGQRELGMDDPFVINFPSSLLDRPESESELVDQALYRIAERLVVEETIRYRLVHRRFSFNPLFGEPSPIVKPNQCFVIAPFNAARTIIYNTVIKPTVEANGCACLRVDEAHENRAITQTIWYSLCEAHFVIADLTGGNANVFYELGIAHTLGKEVILIEEQSPDDHQRRMFDTYSLAAILYRPDVEGGFALQAALDARIKSTLARVTIPDFG